MSLSAARRVFLLALAVLLAGYFAMPGLRPGAVGGFGLVSAAAVAFGAVRQRSPRRWAWLMLGLGILVLTAGDVVYSLTLPRVRPLDYPTSTDTLYLVAYLPLTVGLLWLGRHRLGSRDWALVLDTAALSVALALIVWITLIRPVVVGAGMTGIGRLTAIASWVGFIAVLAACARVVLAWRSNVALALLSVGVLGFVVSDFLYGRAVVTASGPDAGPVDLGFLAFCGFVGAAALHPSMAAVASAPYARHQLGPWRLAILAIALLVAPTALLVEATEGPISTGLAISIALAGVGVLMLVRLAASGRAYRSRAAREHAGRLASRALVVATTRDQVEAGLSGALGRMLPGDTPSRAVVIDRGFAEGAQPEPTTIIGTPDPGELRITVVAPEMANGARMVVFQAPAEHLTELTPVLEGLAEQAGSAMGRIDLTARLRADDRERYFRTLVVTSTDVILISRNGRIEYATPSALRLFGRDVIGMAFEDLVERDVTGLVHHEVVDQPAVQMHDTTRPQPGRHRRWSASEDGAEGHIHRPDGSTVAVLVHRRDLSDDPTVDGVVSTLRDVTAEWDLRRSLAYRASHDSLTGLANAETLRNQLRADREVRHRGDDLFSVMLFIDLDDFKSVNDTFGHEVGDGLLVTVARRIEACLRGNDVAARLGGDEFAALLRDVAGVAEAQAAAQRVAESLARPAKVGGLQVDSRASIGLAIARTPAEFDSLLRRADTALYTAKAGGKGQWRQYQEGMLSPVRRRTDLRDELHEAIRDDKLTIHYQPIVELETGRATGFEALIRLDRGAGPPMLPEELIALAEDSALIIPLGDWIMRRALADAPRLTVDADEPRYVSVNVSVRQLRQPGFVDVVRAHLASAGVPASSLVIEITESLLLDEDERAWNGLAELRRDGVRIAIDDYGTGYASLSYLRQSAIDIIKIDRRFLADLGSQRSRILLEGVLAVTGNLGLDQIAEGVEDAYAREVLRALGCRYGQGFLYGHAMPLAEARAWTPPL